MKFETTPAFDGDFRRLKPAYAAAFRDVVPERLAPACDAYARDPSTPWRGSLRIKSVRGAPGVLEMTWSCAGPDGRATFELITVEGELRCRFRRLGDHGVFEDP